MMTTSDPKTELEAAQRALANFDHSSLTDAEGQPSAEAEHRLAALQQRVAAAKAAVEASINSAR